MELQRRSEERGTDPASDRDRSRRTLLKHGAVLVPTIFTLTAVPAWAQTDYTSVAYRYGTQAGFCRNPHFNPNANPESHVGQEFVECP